MKKRTISFSPPDISELEIEQVISVLRSGWITTGPRTAAFEKKISDYCGTTHTICMNSATSAMEMTLRLLGIGPGDEVITSAYTFTATAAVIEHVGARIVLADTEPGSFRIDPEQLRDRITFRTKAVIPVDVGGVMCDYERIAEVIREKRHLFCPGENRYQQAFGRPVVIADAAHSFGAVRNGVHSGAAADFTCFSFHAVKNLTTGDGGAVTTDDASLADMIRAIANYGSEQKYHFKYKGCTSRLDELQAAILRVKLPHLDSDNMHRSEIARFYLEHLHNPLVSIPSPMEEKANVWHQFPVFCNNRDALIEHLKVSGVETLIHYPVPPHFQPCYAEWGRPSFPITEEIHRTEVSLPISSVMSAEDAALVVDAVNAFKC